MTTEELKKEITEILGGQYHTQLYFVMKVDNQLSVRLADVEEKTTISEIQKMFVDFINKQIVDNDGLVIRNLSIADETIDSIYLYDYETFPEEVGIFNDFKIQKGVTFQKFDFRKDDLSQLFGYIIYIGSMDKGIVLFKKHYPFSLIKRDTFLLSKSNERFTKMPAKDIVRLNSDIQLLRVGESIFVFDLKMLERNMGFTELITKAANETVEAIRELDILDDIQVLKDTLDEVSFSRKLSKVKKSSPIFKLGISKEAIITFTKTTPALADVHPVKRTMK